MVEIINELFVYFVWEMGVLGQVSAYQAYAQIALGALGTACVFIGIRSYKLFFSISVFALVGIGFTYILRPYMDWGAIVILFAIVGTIFAFAAYNVERIGAAAVSVSNVLMISLVFFQDTWIYLVIAMVILASSFFYPKFTVIVTSVAFGSLLLKEVIHLNSKMTIGLVILGIIIQYLIIKGETYARGFKKRN